MINAQAYHDTSLSNLLLTEKCSTGLSVNYKFKVCCPGIMVSISRLVVGRAREPKETPWYLLEVLVWFVGWTSRRYHGVSRARRVWALPNRNPVTNETILDGWAESTSHDTECVTGTPCPTSVKNISFVTESRARVTWNNIFTVYLSR